MIIGPLQGPAQEAITFQVLGIPDTPQYGETEVALLQQILVALCNT